ncbi:MAG: EFR1 family ferrodoxin [Firmicutes bacterium]|nr:EFR1 family ferrodoxin [Bacillota bacterium]
MIFYFTATGNSLYVAKQLDTDRYSIAQEIHKENREYKAEKIGIVCPLFEFEMPNIVKEFIKGSTFETEYFYIIVTYGMHDGGVAKRSKEFMDSLGKKVDYINTIKMHDNAIIVFDMDEQRTLEEGKKVDEHIALLKKDIEEGKEEIQFARKEELEFQAEYRKMIEKTGPAYSFPLYKVTDACVGCGTCTKVCPGGCIQIKDKKVIYDYTNCVNCMACAQACPTMAIQFATIKEPNPKARYRNVHISLKEIIDSNIQK